MRRNGWKNWLAVLIVSVLLLPLASCVHSPVPAAIIPVEWPEFPDPGDHVQLLADGIVAMPLTYWIAIVTYVVEIQRIREIMEVEE